MDQSKQSEQEIEECCVGIGFGGFKHVIQDRVRPMGVDDRRTLPFEARQLQTSVSKNLLWGIWSICTRCRCLAMQISDDLSPCLTIAVFETPKLVSNVLSDLVILYAFRIPGKVGLHSVFNHSRALSLWLSGALACSVTRLLDRIVRCSVSQLMDKFFQYFRDRNFCR